MGRLTGCIRCTSLLLASPRFRLISLSTLDSAWHQGQRRSMLNLTASLKCSFRFLNSQFPPALTPTSPSDHATDYSLDHRNFCELFIFVVGEICAPRPSLSGEPQGEFTLARPPCGRSARFLLSRVNGSTVTHAKCRKSCNGSISQS